MSKDKPTRKIVNAKEVRKHMQGLYNGMIHAQQHQGTKYNASTLFHLGKLMKLFDIPTKEEEESNAAIPRTGNSAPAQR